MHKDPNHKSKRFGANLRHWIVKYCGTNTIKRSTSSLWFAYNRILFPRFCAMLQIVQLILFFCEVVNVELTLIHVQLLLLILRIFFFSSFFSIKVFFHYRKNIKYVFIYILHTFIMCGENKGSDKNEKKLNNNFTDLLKHILGSNDRKYSSYSYRYNMVQTVWMMKNTRTFGRFQYIEYTIHNDIGTWTIFTIKCLWFFQRFIFFFQFIHYISVPMQTIV